MDGRSSVTKSIELYSQVANKWNDNQFGEFKTVLKLTGQLEAYETLTDLLDKNQVYILSVELKGTSIDGCYEGLLTQAESVGNEILEYYRTGKIVVGREFKISETERKEIVGLINAFLEYLLDKKIWWNPCKPKLACPTSYQERFIYKSRHDKSHELQNLIEEEKLIVVIDSPGMGKSTALTKLDLEIRQQLSTQPRLVLRVNLNHIQDEIERNSSTDDKIMLNSFIRNYVKYIPIEDLGTEEDIPAYVLLDGLDEVSAEHQNALISILKSLLQEFDVLMQVDCRGIFLKNIVLTTRPHLKQLIENELKLKCYSLKPLTLDQQKIYLKIANNLTKEEAENKITILPKEVQEVMSNPLMLHLYSQIAVNVDKPLDLFDLYSLFIEKKHEIQLTQKEEMQLHKFATKQRKRAMLEDNLRYYNWIALDNLGIFETLKISDQKQLTSSEDSLANWAQKPRNKHKIQELISYGIVVLNANGLTFKHRTFAEFFYSQLLSSIQETPVNFRNKLFATFFDKKNKIVTKFVSSFLNLTMNANNLKKLISKDWTRWIPIGKSLSDYQWEEFELLDTIFTHHIDYKDEQKERGVCELLVRETFETCLFGTWLLKQNNSCDWVRTNVFCVDTMGRVCDNMVDVVAAMTLSILPSIDLSAFLSRDEIRDAIQRCKYLIQIMVKWKYNEIQVHSEKMRERILKWLSWEEIIKAVKEERYEDKYFYIVVEDVNLSVFYAEAMSKDQMISLISNEKSRITDVAGVRLQNVRRRWGDEFIPENLLEFSCKYGENQGKRLLQLPIPDDLMDTKVWDEIEESPEAAIQLILEDTDFAFIRNMESSILRTDGKHLDYSIQIARSSASKECSRVQNKFRRASLFQKILNEAYIRSRNLLRKNQQTALTSWSSNNLCYLLKYGLVYDNTIAVACSTRSSHILTCANCFVWLVAYNMTLGDKKINSIKWLFLLMASHQPKLGSQQSASFLLNLKEANHENLFKVFKVTEESANGKFSLDYITLEAKIPPWEIMFEFLQTDGAETKFVSEQYSSILISVLTSFKIASCGLYESMRACWKVLTEPKLIKGDYKQILLKGDVLQSITTTVRFWRKGCQKCKKRECYLESVMQFYCEIFSGNMQWVTTNTQVLYMAVGKENVYPDWLGFTIPMELLAAAESKWGLEDKFLPELETRIRKSFLPCDNPRQFLRNKCESSEISHLQYNTETEWSRLIHVLCRIDLSGIKFNDKAYTDSWSPLLRVIMKIDKERDSLADFVNESRLWLHDALTNDMEDGELLHAAIELGTLTGVKRTAFPGLIIWKNNEGIDATQLALQTWGKQHPITKFLQERQRATWKTDLLVIHFIHFIILMKF